MIEHNKAVVWHFIESLNGSGKTPEIVNRFVADERLKEHIAAFELAFPNYQFTIEDMVAEGDKVVVRSIMHGKQAGALMGIMATGRQVAVPIIYIFRVVNDKIVGFWMQEDALSLLQQLGVEELAHV